MSLWRGLASRLDTPGELADLGARIVLAVLIGVALGKFWKVRAQYRSPLITGLILWLAASEVSIVAYMLFERELWGLAWLTQAPRIAAMVWLLRVMSRLPGDDV